MVGEVFNLTGYFVQNINFCANDGICKSLNLSSSSNHVLQSWNENPYMTCLLEARIASKLQHLSGFLLNNDTTVVLI